MSIKKDNCFVCKYVVENRILDVPNIICKWVVKELSAVYEHNTLI